MMKRMGSKAGVAGLKAMMGGLGGGMGGGMPGQGSGAMPSMDAEALKKLSSQLPQGMGGSQLLGKGGLGSMPGLGGLPGLGGHGGKSKRKK